MSRIRNFFLDVLTGRNTSLTGRIVQGCLLPLSWIYGLGIATRNFLYTSGILHSVDLSRPVISVGNLTWGGSGKTPFVLYLAQLLQRQGDKPAILTRGYMGQSGIQSDEAQMLCRELAGVAIGVGTDRWIASQGVLAQHSVDVFIMDDGFQHRRVKRGLDIVLVDAVNPFGNKALIPAGCLREPVSALHRADVIILTKTDLNKKSAEQLKNDFEKCFPGVLVLSSTHQPQGFVDLVTRKTQSLDALVGKKVVGFCAIADPGSFEKMLLGLKAEVLKIFAYPDHYVYTQADLEEIFRFVDEHRADILITTAKDEVKILSKQDQFKNHPCLILKINMEFSTGHDELLHRINRILGH